MLYIIARIFEYILTVRFLKNQYLKAPPIFSRGGGFHAFLSGEDGGVSF
jgi:hypothetical protein